MPCLVEVEETKQLRHRHRRSCKQREKQNSTTVNQEAVAADFASRAVPAEHQSPWQNLTPSVQTLWRAQAGVASPGFAGQSPREVPPQETATGEDDFRKDGEKARESGSWEERHTSRVRHRLQP